MTKKKKTAATIAAKMGVEMEYKPEITLDEKLYPDLKNLKVDDIVKLEIKVKITNISKSQYDQNGKLHVRGTIENAKREDSYGEDD